MPQVLCAGSPITSSRRPEYMQLFFVSFQCTFMTMAMTTATLPTHIRAQTHTYNYVLVSPLYNTMVTAWTRSCAYWHVIYSLFISCHIYWVSASEFHGEMDAYAHSSANINTYAHIHTRICTQHMHTIDGERVFVRLNVAWFNIECYE